MAEKRKILIIDDEENMRHVLRSILEKDGYQTCLAVDGRDALDILEKQEFDIILCDLRMPPMDGIEFLKQPSVREINSTIISMSAYGTIDLAIETMKLGAYDYISKPFKPAEILLTLKKAEEREQLKQENLGDLVLLPPRVLNEDGLFLDNWTVDQLQEKLNVACHVYSEPLTELPQIVEELL